MVKLPSVATIILPDISTFNVERTKVDLLHILISSQDKFTFAVILLVFVSAADSIEGI